MAVPTYWTAEMVRQLPDDGNRYEVVHGELLVTPAPRLDHQLLLTRLTVALANYLAREPVGIVLTSPADISWGPDVLVQPDVFVALPEEVRSHAWTSVRSLLLVAEVLSPSTARADRFTKRHRYQEARVPTYWIVDGDQQRVEGWTSDADWPVIESDRVVWRPAGARESLTIELADLFCPV